MGLTHSSTGKEISDIGLTVKKQSPQDMCIAIAGNPNVGKSTVFNALTGMNQHTGNWPGKTVTNAQGHLLIDGETYVLVDIPGTYSLLAHSPEEEVARNFICFGEPDAVILVCDATCLERNLNLVLQTLEITSKVIVCVNLMDEAAKKHIKINCKKLSSELGVPVVPTVARKKKSLEALKKTIAYVTHNENGTKPVQTKYCPEIEKAIEILQPCVEKKTSGRINSRWLSLRLLDFDESMRDEIVSFFGEDISQDEEIKQAMEKALSLLSDGGTDKDDLCGLIISTLVGESAKIAQKSVIYEKKDYDKTDRKLDRLFTGRLSAYPIMFLLLLFIFWLTINGANYPSSLLSEFLFYIQDKLLLLFDYLNAPKWLSGALILGAYRMLAWVVSVMLPPMAIFFPLFTLLEDSGYLPRVAYNLDKPFKKCKTCGKQALTMCMGFGCNAAGVVGCRIIDSKRERIIAMITNSFVPCNGRFPILIAVIGMFFVGSSAKIFSSISAAFILTLLIISGILLTFLISRILSSTVFAGVPSSFTLELPPYRRPQIGKVLVRSIFDRTLFVLGRAAAVSAPAGVIIWILANTEVNDVTLLSHFSGFLDPFAKIMGLDGIILMAFILGFPASETVIPIMLMAYMSQGMLIEYESLAELKNMLVSNGWTISTALCTMIFTMFHWPCSTTVLTIKKESKSFLVTALSVLIPTVTGIVLCIAVNAAFRIFL